MQNNQPTYSPNPISETAYNVNVGPWEPTPNRKARRAAAAQSQKAIVKSNAMHLERLKKAYPKAGKLFLAPFKGTEDYKIAEGFLFYVNSLDAKYRQDKFIGRTATEIATWLQNSYRIYVNKLIDKELDVLQAETSEGAEP